jgi:uncharacterized protein YbjT (DUF2867 family)
MNVVVLGATGMVGQGVLHACLRDEGVEQVTVISRRSLAVRHPKLRVVLYQDFSDLTPVAGALGPEAR